MPLSDRAPVVPLINGYRCWFRHLSCRHIALQACVKCMHSCSLQEERAVRSNCSMPYSLAATERDCDIWADTDTAVCRASMHPILAVHRSVHACIISDRSDQTGTQYNKFVLVRSRWDIDTRGLGGYRVELTSNYTLSHLDPRGLGCILCAAIQNLSALVT